MRHSALTLMLYGSILPITVTYLPQFKAIQNLLLEHPKPQTINQRIRALNAYLDLKSSIPGIFHGKNPAEKHIWIT